MTKGGRVPRGLSRKFGKRHTFQAHLKIERLRDFCQSLVRKFRKSSANFCKWNRAKRKRPPGIANLPIGAGAILCSLAPLREPGGCGLAVGFRLVWNGLSALKEKWERPSQGGASLCPGLTWAALSGLKPETIPVPDSFSSFVVKRPCHGELLGFKSNLFRFSLVLSRDGEKILFQQTQSPVFHSRRRFRALSCFSCENSEFLRSGTPQKKTPDKINRLLTSETR